MRQLVQATIALFKLGHSLLMVRSIGKSGFRFKIRISDLQSNGKSEKGFEKLSLRTAVLHAHAYLAKRRPLFTRMVL